MNTKIKNLKNKIFKWDKSDIQVLKNLLDELQQILDERNDTDVFYLRLEDIISLDSLPTCPIEKNSDYPIWAQDNSGNCLTGAGEFEIQNINEIGI